VKVAADIELCLGLRDLRGLRDLEVHAPFIADLVARVRSADHRVPAFQLMPPSMAGQRSWLLARRHVASTDQFACFRIDAFDEIAGLTCCKRFRPWHRAVIDKDVTLLSACT